MNKQITLSSLTKIFLLAFSICGFSVSAYSAFSVDDLHQASKSAAELFATNNPDHLEHLTGYKTWKSGDNAKVKIYVSHGGMNMDFNFVCYKHEILESNSTQIQCHDSPN